jgi:hypothetical protein
MPSIKPAIETHMLKGQQERGPRGLLTKDERKGSQGAEEQSSNMRGCPCHSSSIASLKKVSPMDTHQHHSAKSWML